MSKHRSLRSPAAADTSAAAAAPPAGPLSTASAAWSAARSKGASPPLDCMIRGSGRPSSAARAASARRYEPTSGESAASTSVVAARSNSRNVPTTSWESETCTPSGNRARSASPTAISCDGSR